MDKDNQVYLKQIVEAGQKVIKYLTGVTLEKFEKNEQLQDAVIRKLEVIGEAANRLDRQFLEENKNIPLVMAVAMRNKLVHDYDEIDIKVVFDTVKKDVSGLIKDVWKLLR